MPLPPDDVWRTSPDRPVLDARDVHVWRIALDLPDVDIAALNALVLSPDERARTARYFRPIDGARFCAARARLRQVLARYTGGSPGDITFVVDDCGKPHLAVDNDEAEATHLAFNLSHSGGLALVAVARAGSVGVDVETARGHNDLAAIAARYFSPRERAYLAGLSDEARSDAFFVLWTAKEAYTKAIGKGLSLGFTRFDVVVGADGGLRLGDLPDDGRRAGGGRRAHSCAPLPRGERDSADGLPGAWSLRRLAPGPGYYAALAVDRADGHIACWDWPAGRTDPTGTQDPADPPDPTDTGSER